MSCIGDSILSYTMLYTISGRVGWFLQFFGQGGLVPALEPQEVSGLITGSEQILKDSAKSASLTAKDVKKLIEDILHNLNSRTRR